MSSQIVVGEITTDAGLQQALDVQVQAAKEWCAAKDHFRRVVDENRGSVSVETIAAIKAARQAMEASEYRYHEACDRHNRIQASLTHAYFAERERKERRERFFKIAAFVSIVILALYVFVLR